MLDFTKFGIFLGIILFTKKLPTFTQFWDFGFFSCDTWPKMTQLTITSLYTHLAQDDSVNHYIIVHIPDPR